MLPELVIVQPPLANVFAALAARPLWLVEFNTMSGVAFTPEPAVPVLEVLDAVAVLDAVDAVEDLLPEEDFVAALEDADVLGAGDAAEDETLLAGVVAAAFTD
jgi:hypothetical protein